MPFILAANAAGRLSCCMLMQLESVTRSTTICSISQRAEGNLVENSPEGHEFPMVAFWTIPQKVMNFLSISR